MSRLSEDFDPSVHATVEFASITARVKALSLLGYKPNHYFSIERPDICVYLIRREELPAIQQIKCVTVRCHKDQTQWVRVRPASERKNQATMEGK